jgi:hypothetical protein
MKQHILVLALCILIAGCASSSSTTGRVGTAAAAQYARSAERYPYVEFVGDDISAGLVSAAGANYPNWKCTDCQAGATTSVALAGFAAVVAKKPDVIHILIGTYDIVTPAYANDPDCGQNSCQNLSAMLSMANAAGIKVVLGTIPPFGVGPLAQQLSPNGQGTFEQFYWNRSLQLWPLDGTSHADRIVDYSTALANPATIKDDSGPSYQPNLTDNGVDPDAAGYQVMIAQAQAAIQSLQVGPTTAPQ